MTSRLSLFLAELRRRKVVRVAVEVLRTGLATVLEADPGQPGFMCGAPSSSHSPWVPEGSMGEEAGSAARARKGL